MDDDDELRCFWRWASGYDTDPITPILVEHHVDYGDPFIDADGRHRFGHQYNYLTYRFREDGAAAEAMHYMDEDERVTVQFSAGVGEDLAAASFARRVLIFLAMRYDRIELDEKLMAEVRAWRDEFMRREGR